MRLNLSFTTGISSDFVLAGTGSVTSSDSLTDRYRFTDELSSIQLPHWTPQLIDVFPSLGLYTAWVSNFGSSLTVSLVFFRRT